MAAVLAAAVWWAGIAGAFLAIVALPALLAWATAILIFRGIRAWRVRKLPGKAACVVLAPAVLLCVAPVVFVLTAWLVGELFDWGTLAVKLPSYSHIIALSRQRQLPARGATAFQKASDGTLFEAERQEANRIAFPFPGGFLNNWNGILYDPAGVGRRGGVTRADGSREDLFDNWWTIEKCTHMIGHFYSCGFS